MCLVLIFSPFYTCHYSNQSYQQELFCFLPILYSIPYPEMCLLLLLLLSFSTSLSYQSADIPELRQSLNPALNPCTDFYQFVCDGFLRSAQPKSECSEVSAGATRKVQVQAQLEALLAQQPALSSASASTAFHLRQMYAFNSACLQWPQKYLEASEAVLDRMEQARGGAGGTVPTLNTEWALRAFPASAFFQIATAVDTRKGRNDPERRVPAIQPKTLLTSYQDRMMDEQMLISGSAFASIMRALLRDDVVRALKRRLPPVLLPLGLATIDAEVRAQNCPSVANCRMGPRMEQMVETEAQRRVRSLAQVERVLAATSGATPGAYDQSPAGVRNFVPLAQLDSVPAFRWLNWTRLLTTVLAPVRAMGPSSSVYIAGHWPGLMQGLGLALSQLNPQQLGDYLDWHVLWPFLPQMDSRFSHPFVKQGTAKAALNLAEPCPLTKRMMRNEEKCEKFVEWYFPHLLDRVYIQRHGDPQVREDIRRIYGSVYTAFRGMIQANKWMDGVSRQKAMAKLNALQADLLYFGTIFDEAHLSRIYGPYGALNTAAPFPVLLHQLEGVSLLRRLASNEFYESSWTINAFYSRENNAMIALNAYLQTPIYYGPAFPAPVNFAGVGVVLGHELSHAFDDWGSHYDAEGRLGDWLGPQMRLLFQQKKKCFVEQYGRFGVQVPGSGVISVNGSLTANENIADNGGLAAAYYAWELYDRMMGSRVRRDTVRGLEQYNGQQLFFINYAFRNCAKLGAKWLKQRLQTGWHAVGPARVNVPLQNLPAFSRAFNCPRGTPMNPQWMCKIW